MSLFLPKCLQKKCGDKILNTPLTVNFWRKFIEITTYKCCNEPSPVNRFSGRVVRLLLKMELQKNKERNA